MIQSTRGKLAEQALAGRFGKGFPPDLARRARLLLSFLDAAASLEDFRSPPGNRLEKLSGNRAGEHSVRLNQQWRICFRWTDDGPADVEITDYH